MIQLFTSIAKSDKEIEKKKSINISNHAAMCLNIDQNNSNTIQKRVSNTQIENAMQDALN